MLIYNVFGRYLGVKREGARWLVFRVDLTERKFSRLYDIIIPDEMPEEAIPGWLDDLFHEAATARYPGVQRVE
ncbi:TPA: hypothetical protein ACGBUC_000725 [Klebsiella variicola]|uniref:DUF7661 family protein n=1 Tax=Klebsiella TaxID=570 RepID=UPI0007D0C2D9|nr:MULTISPECIES: hypothetical protein [Klebsiella]PJR52671.1 hypothetical protein CWM58_05990 [Klebsiella sp. H-Nf2]PJR56877.1 hypothetical protein CWM64_02165 [Klebsiella sp. I-Nf8]PJR67189.1 hypothetical protein CWM61_02825 [Klebsiella sp. K-Nf6]PJX29262.1 hypothetical protein CWM53_25565 [Klebsiella sp. A-Nf5]PJX38937.1 hypothetical protein CWM59_04065 [Klebsiella sp. B-Nf7]